MPAESRVERWTIFRISFVYNRHILLADGLLGQPGWRGGALFQHQSYINGIFAGGWGGVPGDVVFYIIKFRICSTSPPWKKIKTPWLPETAGLPRK